MIGLKPALCLEDFKVFLFSSDLNILKIWG
jgi:hypothetical protein